MSEKRAWRLTVEPGVQLHLEAKRRDAAERLPVLFANGITMSTDSWNPLGRLLEAERPVARYDMRGQGASDKPAGPYRRERHARDLLAVLADLAERGLTPLHLVGLSNGGYVAQLLLAWLVEPALAPAELTAEERERLASLRPSVAGVALLDSFATVDARLAAAVRAWLGALEWGGAAARFDAALPWVWGPEFLARNAEALADARALAAGQPQAAVRALLEGLLLSYGAEPDLRPALERAGLPLLVAVGADDVLTPARASREILTRFGRNPERYETIPEAGHASPIENAAGVAALLTPFLRAADGARPGANAM